MNYPLNRLLLWQHVMVVVLLEAEWSLVFCAPAPHSVCKVLDKTKRLTDTIRHEADKLVAESDRFHGPMREPTGDSTVPDSTISGSSSSEKLQNIYTKDELFQWHLSNVLTYHTDVWKTDQTFLDALTSVKSRLSDHLIRTKHLLNVLDPECPLPTKAALPELSHGDNYAKKKYVQAVVYRLRDLFIQVPRELTDMKEKEQCDEAPTGTRK